MLYLKPNLPASFFFLHIHFVSTPVFNNGLFKCGTCSFSHVCYPFMHLIGDIYECLCIYTQCM